MKYFIKTFGCQQNVADSERLEARMQARGMTPAKSYEDANYVVVNTCMVRENAENRVYGLINNLKKIKEKKDNYKIIVTGCMVGVAFRDPSGKYLQKIKKSMPAADEFMPIEEVGFDFAPIRTSDTAAWVPISNGCNNFCTFCIVPFTRGREISRPYKDIIEECQKLAKDGYTEVTLLGQNVNSYGADLVVGAQNIQVMRDLPHKDYVSGESSVDTHSTHKKKPQKKSDEKDEKDDTYYEINGKKIKPIYVSHLGRKRIPTLFPYLLQEVAHMGFQHVGFVSSNPWDFSDELIKIIGQNKNITRTLHLPVQHGDNNVLKRMNRWYTREEYMNLIKKIRSVAPEMKFTTDIIVGFCDESEAEFEKTVSLCKEVGFYKAYVAMYSPRPMTAATKVMKDNVPHDVKRTRWRLLDTLINKPHIESFKKSPQHMHKKKNYSNQLDKK